MQTTTGFEPVSLLGAEAILVIMAILLIVIIGSAVRSSSSALDKYLVRSFTEVAVIGVLIGFVIHILIGRFAWESYSGGLALWTVVVWYTPAVNLWFVNPLLNHVAVIENALRKQERLTTDIQLTTPQPTSTMRVIFGPTLSGKQPWERVRKVINTQRSISLGGRLEVITKDNVKCFVRWKMFLTSIPSELYLINLARCSESTIIQWFTAVCEAYIQSQVKTMTYEELFEKISEDPADERATVGQAKLKNGFSSLFGGEHTLHKAEKRFGVFTNDPKISEIVPDPAYQRAKQSEAAAKAAIAGIKVYTAERIHPDIAANLNCRDRGEEPPAQINKTIIEGLERAAHAHVVVGSLVESGSKK